LPKENDTLAYIREKNKIKAEKQLIKASMNQFECANTEKTQKTKERMKKYIQEEEAKLKFNKPKAIALPTLKEENARFRLNAASIMREGLLFQKKEEEEQKKLEDLAVGGRDASEFLQWQNNMRRKDLEAELADIEAKRLAGRLSYEEAILARQALIEENKQKVTDVKKETKEMMDEYLKEKFKTEKEMRMLVEQIVDGHKNAKEAKVKLRKYKQSIVAEVNNKSKELMQKALEEAEQEMREKVALIAKIRAIESAPRIRFKYVDPTETSGIGLLGEMSVAELKERLNLLKIEAKKEEQRKRDEILQSKVDKDQCLMETLEAIAKHRAEKERSSAKRLEERASASKIDIKDAKVLELQERLSARRAERERFRIQSSPPKLTEKQRLKKKDSFDEKQWKEIEIQREKALRLHAESASRTSSRTKLITR